MRVALYARVSTEEQAIHGLSIDAQLAALDEWAKDKTVIDRYVDLGISARKPITKRPELQRLLRDVEQNRVDLIAFCKLDRWTRNIREYYKAQDVLDAHNVAWRAIQEDYETETASGRLKVNLMLAIAQDEADRTSERVRAVFQRKREKGLATTGSVPIGVKIEDGRYVPSEEAETARHIFKTYISTRSLVETGRRFGYSTPGIKNLLTNDVFLTSGAIDRSTWETVQSIVQTRSQRHVRTDRVYLFTGIIFCPHCGSRMATHRVTGYTYYRCQRHYYSDCPGFNCSEKNVEKYLLDHLMECISEYNMSVRGKEKKVDVSALKRKQNKLTDLYMNDLINREKYESEFRALQSQIEEAELSRKPIDEHEVHSLLESYNEWSPKARKTFWSYMVKSIVPNGKEFEITIFYT